MDIRNGTLWTIDLWTLSYVLNLYRCHWVVHFKRRRLSTSSSKCESQIWLGGPWQFVSKNLHPIGSHTTQPLKCLQGSPCMNFRDRKVSWKHYVEKMIYKRLQHSSKHKKRYRHLYIINTLNPRKGKKMVGGLSCKSQELCASNIH